MDPDFLSSMAPTLIGCFCGMALGLVLNVVLAVWAVKDIRARVSGSPGMWALMVILIGPIALIMYLMARPQGNLVECGNCYNRKLESSRACPHCGFKRKRPRSAYV